MSDNNELTEIEKTLVSDALAVAIVTTDGKVFYRFGNDAILNSSSEDASKVIDAVSKLLSKKGQSNK